MIFVFDVDGVLTDTGYDIDTGFKNWFLNWAKDKRYALVTGSTIERTREQIGDEIVDGAMLVANCMGNSIFQEGRTVVLNEFRFTREEEDFLTLRQNQSPFPIRAGQHIAARPGSFNFSVVGRNANEEQREQYKIYDNKTQERLDIAREFKQRFPRFDVFIGGDISIDICLRGAHKGQVMDLFFPFLDGTERIVFFGDKMDEWGIDKPLADRMGSERGCRWLEVKEGYEQTKYFLETSV